MRFMDAKTHFLYTKIISYTDRTEESFIFNVHLKSYFAKNGQKAILGCIYKIHFKST